MYSIPDRHTCTSRNNELGNEEIVATMPVAFLVWSSNNRYVEYFIFCGN